MQKIKRQYPDARHHCWAFAAGAPDDSNLYGCGDDGEPAGTAGRPMLAQLAGGEIGEIAAVVVRYFGGTKLGTGGLVRAYSSSVAMALSQLPTHAKQALSQLWVQGPHHLASVVEHCAAMHQAEVLQRLYSNEVTFQLQVPKAQYQTLQQLLQNRSKGSLTLSPTPLS